MTDQNPSHLPSEWQSVDHYDLRVGWLTRTPRPDLLEMQESARELVRKNNSDQAETFSLEIAGLPGWWSDFNVAHSNADSLEDVLQEAKRILKNSTFEEGGLFAALFTGERHDVPASVSKSQRVKLIDQIMHPPAADAAHHDWDRMAFLEISPGHALFVSIENVAYCEEFETDFSSPSNPLRSLVGREVIVSFQSYGDDAQAVLDADEDLDEELDELEAVYEEMLETDPELQAIVKEEEARALAEARTIDVNARTEDGRTLGADTPERVLNPDRAPDGREYGAEPHQRIAQGVLTLEGEDGVRVGEWVWRVIPDLPVFGIAFEEAQLEDEDVMGTFLFDLPETVRDDDLKDEEQA
jgi:hypothetical protein